MLIGSRFAIDEASVDWTAAETQVARIGGGKASQTIVSVKKTAGGDNRKRKADGEGDPASGKASGGGGDKKSSRRSKKVKR